jgi:hypothetical protein
MSLSSRDYNKIVDKINTTFYKLGYANGMQMPPSDSNTEPAAWKMWVAYHLARIADKYKDSAEWEAAQAGIIPDKEKNPQMPGNYGIIYSGDNVSISLEVRKSSERIDARKLIDILLAAGIDKDVLNNAVRAATKPSGRGAHMFVPNLIREHDFGK